jgi:hypothetical protein
MNDYDREQMVAWGAAAASYAIFEENSNMATATMENAVAQGIIEGQHTQSIVTRNTGDHRLGRIAGLGAEGRTTGWWLALFGAPFALFMGIVGIFVALGSPDSGAGSWIGPFGLVACFVLMVYVLSRLRNTTERNAYARANLPSEKELNKAGYWQVEPDVWFNPIIERVIRGHAYVATEAVQRRQAYRTESQQIHDLYRQQRRRSPRQQQLDRLIAPTIFGRAQRERQHEEQQAQQSAQQQDGLDDLDSLLGPGVSMRSIDKR